eukprot:UN25334
MAKRAALYLLDGGLGRELIIRSKTICPEGSWSAWFSVHQPELLKQVHKDFIRAGANVIITNTYSCTPEVSKTLNIGLKDLIDETCKIAKDAISESREDVLLAGGLPPLTSSHRPELVLPKNELITQYTEILKHLSPHVDIILTETLSCITEAVTAVECADKVGKPVWVGVEVRKGAVMVSGEKIEDLAHELSKFKNVKSLVYNCSTLENVDDSFDILQKMGKRYGWMYGAYPNRI